MSKLNDLFREVEPGQPVTSEDLSALGISADLAVHCFPAGSRVWLGASAPGLTPPLISTPVCSSSSAASKGYTLAPRQLSIGTAFGTIWRSALN